MPRCAIYTRQSSVPGSGETSCNAQHDHCLLFIEMQRWEWIGTRFDDPGFSGATLDRPALKQLIQLAESGGVDVIVVEYLDRLSRSVLDTHSLLEKFRDCGVEVRIATCPWMTVSSSDSFLINLLASFAEFERELIQERIREARAALKNHGKRVGGAVPFGYDTDPHTKQLVVNSEEADRVRAIFEMAADGVLPSRIAQIVNEKGWRTKLREARRTGNKTGGNPWSANGILSILKNPTYCGKITNGDQLKTGAHEAIVADALFAKVSKVIKRRITRPPGRTDRKGYWLLMGKIKCAQCGRLMSPHTINHRNFKYRYYRCRSQAQGKPPCKGIQVRAYDLEEYAIKRLGDLSPEIADGQHENAMVQEFSEAWELLSDDARRKILPEVISEILYDQHAGEITLSLDPEAIERYAKVSM